MCVNIYIYVCVVLLNFPAVQALPATYLCRPPDGEAPWGPWIKDQGLCRQGSPGLFSKEGRCAHQWAWHWWPWACAAAWGFDFNVPMVLESWICWPVLICGRSPDYLGHSPAVPCLESRCHGLVHGLAHDVAVSACGAWCDKSWQVHHKYNPPVKECNHGYRSCVDAHQALG